LQGDFGIVKVRIMKKLFLTYLLHLLLDFQHHKIALQDNSGVESYDQNTKTCAKSKFESNPILTLIGEILI
jgi:hypothetical protein